MKTTDGKQVDFYQCKWTNECQNNKCFWKQRDCYGLEPFPCYIDSNGEYPAMEKNKKILEIYGPTYFPKFNIIAGTNAMYIKCEDYSETT